MKKLITILLASLILVMSFTVGASADEFLTTGLLLTATGASNLPFELKAPQNVTLAKTEDTASWGAPALGISYTVPNDMNQFLIGLEEAEDQEAYLAGYGYYEFLVSLQMDWALDDVNDPVSGWHYNEYWDFDNYFGFGQDSEGRYHKSEWDITETGLGNNDSFQSFWVFPDLPNDERWNGNPENGWVGVKDQLNPDQYEYVIDSDGEGSLRIDYTKHTMYARMRFVFWGTKLDGDDRELFAYSDWSNVASAGKDGE
ncbi:MAG: hypothetical protein IK088_07790, partial [Lachnospiraceae bacterium]|nr:hypothetical protein [Lachnospiraceae bacterium]